MEKNTLLEPIIDLMWEPEEDFATIAPLNNQMLESCGATSPQNRLCSGPF